LLHLDSHGDHVGAAETFLEFIVHFDIGVSLGQKICKAGCKIELFDFEKKENGGYGRDTYDYKSESNKQANNIFSQYPSPWNHSKKTCSLYRYELPAFSAIRGPEDHAHVSHHPTRLSGQCDGA